MIAPGALLLLMAALPLDAATLCGTGAVEEGRAKAVQRWVERQCGGCAPRSLAEPQGRIEEGFIILPADVLTAPFDDPADLEGSTIHFARKGEEGFVGSRTTLLYDEEVGTLFESFGRGQPVRSYALQTFRFPFGDATHEELHFSNVRGIHFQARPSLPDRTISPLEWMTSGAALVAALIDYQISPSSLPDLYLKESSDSLTATWRARSPGMIDYDIQAVLFRNGDIRFSYRTLRNIGWGSVVVSTGKPGEWLSEMQTLAVLADPAGDVDPLFGSSREMLDIIAVHLSRVGGTSLLQLRMDLAAPIDRQRLNPNASFLFFLGDSLNRVELFVRPDRTLYRLPLHPDLVESSAVRIEGSQVFLYVSEEELHLSERSIRVWAYTNAMQAADSVTATVDLGPRGERSEMDFSATPPPAVMARPMVESFGLATVNLPGVWSRLKSSFGYGESGIDAVMVYTSFLTDIITKPHGAFALQSNPGVDGISQYSDRDLPRTPTLISMNHLQAFSDFGTDVQLHELGHRWLYYFEIREGGRNTRSLNPLGNHPAQYVHTPSMFEVFSERDSSVMGGARFTEVGQGRFRSHSAGSWAYGYSAHELYLMGLAAAHEVAPWWYVRDSDPPLGLEYHPPFDLEVSGRRVDVTIDQIVEAMGPRVPSFEQSQKQFRVLFVVLERPGTPISAPDLAYRTRLEEAFSRATGGRGMLLTAPPPPTSRRRAVGRSF